MRVCLVPLKLLRTSKCAHTLNLIDYWFLTLEEEPERLAYIYTHAFIFPSSSSSSFLSCPPTLFVVCFRREIQFPPPIVSIDPYGLHQDFGAFIRRLLAGRRLHVCTRARWSKKLAFFFFFFLYRHYIPLYIFHVEPIGRKIRSRRIMADMVRALLFNIIFRPFRHQLGRCACRKGNNNKKRKLTGPFLRCQSRRRRSWPFRRPERGRSSGTRCRAGKTRGSWDSRTCRSSTWNYWIGRRTASTKSARRSWFRNLHGNERTNERRKKMEDDWISKSLRRSRTGDEGVAGFESSGPSGNGRAVEVQRHDGRVGHELARSARPAEIINLLFVASDRDEGRHAVRPVAAVFTHRKKKNEKDKDTVHGIPTHRQHIE